MRNSGRNFAGLPGDLSKDSDNMRPSQKRKNKNRILLYTEILLLLFMVFSYAIYVVYGGFWLAPLENKWIDRILYSRKESLKKPHKNVFIAAIDEKTTGELGYPLPRKYYAKAIDEMSRLGVKVITMDVMFFEKSGLDKAGDRLLVQSVKKNGNVINLAAVADIGDGIQGLKVPFSEEMADNSIYVAMPNVQDYLDGDGHIRKMALFIGSVKYSSAIRGGKGCEMDEAGCDGLPIAGLAAASYAAYKDISLKNLFFTLEKDPTGIFYLNFRKPRRNPEGEFLDSIYPQISLLDIVRGNLDEEEKETIKGGIALVGSTTLGTFDHYPIFFSSHFPGVEVHATALDNMLEGDFLKRAPYFLEILLLAAFVLIPYFIRKYSMSRILITIVALTLVYRYADFAAFDNQVLLSFVGPMLGLWLSGFLVISEKAIVEGVEKKWIKNTFGQYLSPKVVDIVVKDPSRLELGGEKRDMSVFFLDIAHFTSISEKLEPDQLTLLLNKYLSGLTDVILKYDGVVDKYIGDCIMAFWNAPLDQENHRNLACLAAIDCLKELKRLNEETETTEKPAVRIGINSGDMVVGNMGSQTRFSYTVLGDSVNLASRLEGANKFFSSKIMASEFTHEEAKKDVEARYLGTIRVVGKELSVKTYEPLAKKGEIDGKTAELLEKYGKGVDYFYKGDFEKAQKAFRAALKAAPGDGPSAFYLERALRFAKETPAEWDGTFNLTSK